MKNGIRKSFKRQISASFLVVACLPLILSSVFLIQLFKMKISADYQKKNLAQEKQIAGILTGIFSSFESVTGELAEDETIREVFQEGERRTKREIYSLLYDKTAVIRQCAEVTLYMEDGGCLYSTGAGTAKENLPTYWGILRAAREQDGLILLREEAEEGAGIVLRAARKIPGQEKGSCAGYVVISMKEDDFETVLHGNLGGQDGICILDDHWENVYSSGVARQKDAAEELRRRRMEGERVTENWNDNAVYITPLAESGFSLVLLRPLPFTENTVRSMYSVLLLMALASGSLCAFVSGKLSGHLSAPIQTLNRAMHSLQEGDLKTRIHSKREDEFGQLSASFNAMAEELEMYTKRQVEQQKQLDDVRIAMMQAQLNPHFLYNTLDTMKWVAKANHIPKLATLAAKLAKILRTSISSEQFITLADEIALAESYAEIQSIRFDGKFSFTFEVEEDTRNCMVPKLIVQPIVENAVIHGLSECEEGAIAVETRRQEEELWILISDDGCGMSEEQRNRINSRSFEKRGTEGHIGLYNVDTIIRLHYGEQFGLSVADREGGGLRVMLRLPYEV